MADQGSVAGLSNKEVTSFVDGILMQGNVRDSTDVTYHSYRKQFRVFMVRGRFTIDVVSMERFLLDKFYSTNSGKSVGAAVTALKNRAKLLNIGWLLQILESQRIGDLVEALKKLQPVGRSIERDPVSLALIFKCIEEADSVWPWNLYVKVSVVITLAMRCMSRGGEIANLEVGDLEFVNEGIKIRFKKTKARERGRRVFIERSNSISCPVALVERFLELRQVDPEFVGMKHLFGKFLTSTITGWLRTLAKRFGFAGNYSSHSLRIGGASQAVIAGFSCEMIMLMGDWTSDAVDRYLRSGVQSGRNISSQMGF